MTKLADLGGGKRRGLAILLTALLLAPALALILTTRGGVVEASPDPGWWDSDWSYRAPIVLTIGGNVPPENYQYKIVLDKVDNLNNHCLDNFQDMRFLEDESSGELSFWIENFISGDNATFWVRREDNSLDDNIVYCYYGNASAGSAENGDATFEFFDDFIDTTKGWTTSSRFAIVTSEGVLEENINRIYSNHLGAYVSVPYLSNNSWAVRGRLKIVSYLVPFGGMMDTTNSSSYTANAIGQGTETATFCKHYVSATDANATTQIGRTSMESVSLGTYSTGVWYDFYTIRQGATVKYFFMFENATTTVDVGSSQAYLMAVDADGYTAGTTKVHVDFVTVSKYVSPEPTASVGVEETPAEPPEKPVLVSPENNYSTSDSTPTFVWENGSDATSHRLVIDNSQGFDDGENIYDNAGAWDNSGTTIENELPADNYWWSVCATNAQGDNWPENTWTFEIIINTPPTTPTSLILTPSPCYITDELVGAGSGSTDADDDDITYYYAFYNETDSAMRQDWSVDDSYTLVVALDAHDNIRVFTKAYDGYQYSADNFENSLIIANSTPTAPTSIILTPDPCYVGDELGGEASGATDADGDDLTYYYWFRDENEGIIVQDASTDNTYDIGPSVAHDNIIVIVSVNDPWVSSPTFDNSIIISNTKPIAENQETDNEVNPAHVISDNPVLSWDYSDNDSDTQENFQIQVGTAPDGSDMWDNNQQNSDNFITYAGSALTCATTYHWRVRAWDNEEWSGWLTGGTFVLNWRPVAENQLTENRTNPDNLITFTPELEWGYADNDSDAQEYFWVQVGTTENGNDMWDNARASADNFVEYGGSALDRGVTYHWRVIVTDPYDNSIWLYGGTFRLNQLPTVTVDVTPNSPADEDNLICTPSGSDDDGDTVTYFYQWFCDGVLQAGETENVLDNALTSDGEVWACVVTPYDGLENGENENDSVTIGAVNNPPDTPTISGPADGYDATVGEGIGFSGSATDPDGDELTYEWDFGDGTGTSDEANTTYSYSSPGDYTVTLTVTDPSGETSSITIVINVWSWGPGAPGWVPPEEPPPEEPPAVGIPKPALPIMGIWAALLAVCAVYLSSLQDGPRKRKWARNLSRWVLPAMAVVTLWYIVTQKIALTPIVWIVGGWGLIFSLAILNISSLEPGWRRRRWTRQFLTYVVPALAFVTYLYLAGQGIV